MKNNNINEELKEFLNENEINSNDAFWYGFSSGQQRAKGSGFVAGFIIGLISGYSIYYILL